MRLSVILEDKYDDLIYKKICHQLYDKIKTEWNSKFNLYKWVTKSTAVNIEADLDKEPCHLMIHADKFGKIDVYIHRDDKNDIEVEVISPLYISDYNYIKFISDSINKWVSEVRQYINRLREHVPRSLNDPWAKLSPDQQERLTGLFLDENGEEKAFGPTVKASTNNRYKFKFKSPHSFYNEFHLLMAPNTINAIDPEVVINRNVDVLEYWTGIIKKLKQYDIYPPEKVLAEIHHIVEWINSYLSLAQGKPSWAQQRDLQDNGFTNSSIEYIGKETSNVWCDFHVSESKDTLKKLQKIIKEHFGHS